MVCRSRLFVCLLPAFAGTLLVALGTSASLLRGDDVVAERAQLDAGFRSNLDALAAKCDELGLKQQAQITRDWFVVRDTRRQYIFVPAESDPTEPLTSAPVIERQWHNKFRELRATQADGLVQLARQSLAAGQPTAAYQLLNEALRENPDHADARAILGFTQVSGRWRRVGATPSSKTGTVAHPRFRWAPGRYWTIETAHFRISTNDSAKAGLELGQKLEDLYEVWLQLFVRYWTSTEELSRQFADPSRASLPRRKHQVVLFRNRDDYLATLGQAVPNFQLSTGYYSDRESMAFFYCGDARVEATWWHETSHQLFQETGGAAAGVGDRWNFWVVEGIALYMESLVPHDGYFTVGGFDASRLQFARYYLLNQRTYVPLAQLVAMGQNDLQTNPQIQQMYVQSAGLAHFLMDFDGGRYRDALVDYLSTVYLRRDAVETLSKLGGATLPELDARYAEFLSVSDADLKFLNPPPYVRNLGLGNTSVTDEGLSCLTNYTDLAWVDLTATKTTDATLAALQNAKRLNQLNLERTQITDAGLQIVRNFRELEELDLSGTSITDDGLAHLSGLQGLKILWLTGTPVTDAGLSHLKNLKQLEMLDVDGTAVTPEGLRRLKQSLPKLSDSS